jgi:hypothetical protein
VWYAHLTQTVRQVNEGIQENLEKDIGQHRWESRGKMFQVARKACTRKKCSCRAHGREGSIVRQT